MRDRILITISQWHNRHPGIILIVISVVSILAIYFSSQLTVTMRWSDLLPTHDRRTIEYNKILDEFTSASNIIIVVQGEETKIKSFADALAPKLLYIIDDHHNEKLEKEIAKLERKIQEKKKKPTDSHLITPLANQLTDLKKQYDFPLIQRIDYKNEIEFLKQHGLILMKSDDLKNMESLFLNPNLPQFIENLNVALEKEYVEREESLSSREKEDQAVSALDGVESLVFALRKSIVDAPLSREEIEIVADKLLLGDPYFLSYDKTTLIMEAIPNFSVVDLDRVIHGTEKVQGIVDELLVSYPGVKAGLTGMIPLARDEMVYGEQSANYTTLIAAIAILIMLIIAFRMWVAPVLALANLFIGILWAMGLTGLVIGQLNIMTQMMAVILLGLGVDFSIHFISGFTERRAAGDTIASALETTFLKSGKGIVTGALTTAFAFLTMVISSSRGLKEMGLVTGLGLLAILAATLFVLPSLLVLRERRVDRKAIQNKAIPIHRDISFQSLGKTGFSLGRNYRFTLFASFGLTAVLLFLGTRITFDQNYMNMEPKGINSVVLQDTIMDKFDLSMDYAMVLTESHAESRTLSREFRDLKSVALVEDISRYLPSSKEQLNRRPYVLNIRKRMERAQIQSQLLANDIRFLATELDRLSMNVIEMQDMAFLGGQDKVDEKAKRLVGNPEEDSPKNFIFDLVEMLDPSDGDLRQKISQFHSLFAPYFKLTVIQLANTESIQQSDLPESILDRYCNKARTKFLVTAYPQGNIWTDLTFLHRFAGDVEEVSPRTTGMPPVFRALIEIIGTDGRNALTLTIFIVFLLLWADLRHPKYALMAMIPLAAGAIWMVGLMKLFGMQFTVMNIMGLPMIIGIGIDDGVHIVHRWLAEGKGHIRTVFASTGKAILLTSLTTMLAFGSLMFSIWRGFASLGSALFIGVGACFLTTVLILSGIIGYSER